jgi:hypothetical protein
MLQATLLDLYDDFDAQHMSATLPFMMPVITILLLK